MDKSEFAQLLAKYIKYNSDDGTYIVGKVKYFSSWYEVDDSEVVKWAAGTSEPEEALSKDITLHVNALNAYEKTADQPKRWEKIGDDMEAAFSLPCRGVYYSMRRMGWLGCFYPDDTHGHIELSCEDGYAYVGFCCQSQAGVRAVVANLGEEYKGILDMAEVKQLPEELTDKEKAVIDSPEEMNKKGNIHVWYGI